MIDKPNPTTIIIAFEINYLQEGKELIRFYEKFKGITSLIGVEHKTIEELKNANNTRPI